MDKQSRRIDWHRVGFWGAIGSAAALILIASVHKDRRVITVFEAEGRYELSKFMRYNFPETADWMGLNNVSTAPAPVTSSR